MSAVYLQTHQGAEAYCPQASQVAGGWFTQLWCNTQIRLWQFIWCREAAVLVATQRCVRPSGKVCVCFVCSGVQCCDCTCVYVPALFTMLRKS